MAPKKEDKVETPKRSERLKAKQQSQSESGSDHGAAAPADPVAPPVKTETSSQARSKGKPRRVVDSNREVEEKLGADKRGGTEHDAGGSEAGGGDGWDGGGEREGTGGSVKDECVPGTSQVTSQHPQSTQPPHEQEHHQHHHQHHHHHHHHEQEHPQQQQSHLQPAQAAQTFTNKDRHKPSPSQHMVTPTPSSLPTVHPIDDVESRSMMILVVLAIALVAAAVILPQLLGGASKIDCCSFLPSPFNETCADKSLHMPGKAQTFFVVAAPGARLPSCPFALDVSLTEVSAVDDEQSFVGRIHHHLKSTPDAVIFVRDIAKKPENLVRLQHCFDDDHSCINLHDECVSCRDAVFLLELQVADKAAATMSQLHKGACAFTDSDLCSNSLHSIVESALTSLPHRGALMRRFRHILPLFPSKAGRPK